MVRSRSGNGQDMSCQSLVKVIASHVNIISVSGMDRFGQCQVKVKVWSWSAQGEIKVMSGQSQVRTNQVKSRSGPAQIKVKLRSGHVRSSHAQVRYRVSYAQGQVKSGSGQSQVRSDQVRFGLAKFRSR